ncbi:hypothetical protein FRB90_012687, partial [Tulasnella sp. 427]
VCRRWCGVVDEPILWRRIDASEGLELLRIALGKAQDTLLDLVYKEHTASLPLEDFFEAARDRIGQWNSLVVEACQLKGHCAPIEDSIPPRLRKLHLLEYDDGIESTRHMPLFGGHPAPPSLHDVSFTTIDPNLSQLRLAGLMSLVLRDVHGPKEANFIQILRSSPGLRDIRLESSWLRTSSVDDQTARVQPIRLASLVNITLQGIHFDAIYFILSSIDAPEVQTLTIGCDMHNGQIPIAKLFSRDAQRLLSPLKSILSTAKGIKVSFKRSSSVRMSIGGLKISVGYRSGPTPNPIFNYFRECFEWLGSHIENSIWDLPVHLELQNAYPLPELLQWFTSSVNVKTLTLLARSTARYRPAVDILVRTSARHRPAVGILELLSGADTSLPQLEVISLEVVWRDLESAPECIHKFVDQRRSQHQKQERGESRVGPLQEIRLSAYHEDPNSCLVDDPVPQDDEFLRKVEQAAGGVAIYWEGKRWTSIGSTSSSQRPGDVLMALGIDGE